MIYKILSIIIFFDIFSFSLSQNATIPINEINSVRWILNHYSISYDYDNIKCSSNNQISLICDPNNEHFTQIILNKPPINSPILAPNNYGITSFEFPSLRKFDVYFDGVPVLTTPDNILSMFNNASALGSFTVTITDYTINSIPDVLGTIPLQSLTITSPSITVIPESILYSSIESVACVCAINEIKWNSGKKNTISKLNVKIIDGLNLTFCDYPNTLTDLFITMADSIVNIDTTNLNILALTRGGPILSKAKLFGSSDKLKSLRLSQNFSSFEPLTLDGFTNLSSLSIQYGDIFKDFPYQYITEDKSQIQFISSNLNTFPKFKVSPGKRINTLNLVYNKLQGSIPEQYASFVLNLMVTGNQNVNFIPENACQFLAIAMEGTGIEDAPDCFKCYWYKTTNNFVKTPFFDKFNSTSADFHCPITYEQIVKSYDGKIITITGNNLGWGMAGDSDPKINMLIPNKQFTYKVSGGSNPIIQLSKQLNINIVPTIVYDTITINSVKTTYINGKIILQVIGEFRNTDIPYTFVLDGDFLQTTVVSNIHSPIQFILNQLKPGDNKLTVANQFNSIPFTFTYTPDYPRVIGSTSLKTSGGNLTLYGTFNVTQTTVTIAGKYQCTVIFNSNETLECTVGGGLPVGYQLVEIEQDGYKVGFDRVVTIHSDEVDLVKFCQQTYRNCSNHGYCDSTGVCICDRGFFGVACNQQLVDVPIISNNATSPVVVIGNSDFIFNFSMIAIQEIDSVFQVEKELLLADTWTRLDRIVESDGLIINKYTQNKHQQQLPFKNVELNVMIYVTQNQSKVFDFAGTQITVAPNSIKLTVNVSGWQYSDRLSTLRFVFATESFGDICDSTNYGDIIRDKDGVTIQYIRIFKDNIEYLGRFLSVALSDDRTVFSSTESIGNKMIDGKNMTLLGISMPQCTRNCIVDPDFSSLLNNQGNIDKSQCDKKSNKWKIIVGSVVGGVAFIALAVACKPIYKKIRQWYYIQTDKTKQIELE